VICIRIAAHWAALARPALPPPLQESLLREVKTLTTLTMHPNVVRFW
jgi:hypothetical protein